MNLSSSKTIRLIAVLWALLTLVLFPIGSHVRWLHTYLPLHGVPAFFLGAVVFVVLGTGAWLMLGGFRNGITWIFSGHVLRLILGSTAVVISLVVLFYSVELWRGKRAWQRMVDHAIRQGESLDPKSFEYPIVASQEDFAQAPLFLPLERAILDSKAAKDRYLKADPVQLNLLRCWGAHSFANKSSIRFAPWMEAEKTDLGPWLVLSRTFQGISVPLIQNDRRAVATEILQMLSPLDNLIAELRAHSDRPYCRLPFNYELPLFTDHPSERVLLSFMRVLRLRATAELAINQNNLAFQDFQLLLRLAEYLRQQPSLLLNSDRAWALADGLQPLWEAIHGQRWNVAQLEAIQHQLQAFNPLTDYPSRLRFLAFVNARFVENIIPTTPRALENGHLISPEDQAEILWLRRFYPKGWSLQNQAAIYHPWLNVKSSAVVPCTFSSISDQTTCFVRQLLSASSDPFFPVFLVPRIVQMQSDLVECLPFTQAATHLAMLACSLERFRLNHHAYPDTLDALLPVIINKLPADCIDNTSLHYHRVGDQCYVLYSVGLNRLDNGGQPSPQERNWQGLTEPVLDLRKNDWIWATRPQTP